MPKRFTEEELLEGLDAYSAHADELAEPEPAESEPLDRLKGSVLSFEEPTEPLEDWDHWSEFPDQEG